MGQFTASDSERLVDEDRAAEPTWVYDGFISYGIGADGDLASRIQHGLEQLARPWNKRRALKIFRDIDDLPASPDLPAELREALRRTRTLVFLASADAAASPWCDQELAYWIDARPPEDLVVVLTDGTLEFDPDAERPTIFERSTAAPPAFARLGTVPLYIDMRDERAIVGDLDFRSNVEFRAKLTKVAAALHSNRTGRDVEPRDIDSADLREHRRSRRIRRIGVAALAVLAAGLAVAGWFAYWNAREANDLARTAKADLLAVSAQLERSRDPDLATLLALEADRLERTAETSRALFGAAASPWRGSVRDLTSRVVGPSSFDATGSRFLAAGDDGAIVWPVNGVDPPLVLTSDHVATAAFSRDGARVVTAGERAVEVWDVVDGDEPVVVVLAAVNTAEFDSSGQRVVTAGPLGVAVWDVDGAAPPTWLTDEASISASFDESGRVVSVPDGAALFSAGPGGESFGAARVWDIDDPGSPRQVHSWVWSASFDRGGRMVTATVNGASIWDDQGRELAELTNENVTSAAFDAGGTRVVTVGDAGVVVWELDDREGGALTVTDRLVTDAIVVSAAFAPDGTLVTTDRDGVVDVWRPYGHDEIVISSEAFFDGASFDDDTVTAWNADSASSWQLERRSVPLSNSPFGRERGVMELSPPGELATLRHDPASAPGPGVRPPEIDPVVGPFGSAGLVVEVAGEDEPRAIGAITDDNVYRASLHPDLPLVVTAGSEGAVIWGPADGRPILLTSEDVTDVAFDPTGSRVATAGEAGIVMWDLRGNRLGLISPEWPTTIAFSEDGSTVVGLISGRVYVWSAWDADTARAVLERRLGGRRFEPSECSYYEIDDCPDGG